MHSRIHRAATSQQVVMAHGYQINFWTASSLRVIIIFIFHRSLNKGCFLLYLCLQFSIRTILEDTRATYKIVECPASQIEHSNGTVCSNGRKNMLRTPLKRYIKYFFVMSNKLCRGFHLIDVPYRACSIYTAHSYYIRVRAVPIHRRQGCAVFYIFTIIQYDFQIHFLAASTCSGCGGVGGIFRFQIRNVASGGDDAVTSFSADAT